MNKKINIVLPLLCWCICFIACEKELPKVEVKQTIIDNCISTDEVTNVGLFSAILHGKVYVPFSDCDELSVGFELSIDSLFPEEMTSLCFVDSIASDSTITFYIKRGIGYNVDIPILEPGTRYYTRSFILYNDTYFVGKILSFNTTPIEVITGDIDTINLTINCRVNVFKDDYWLNGELGICFSRDHLPTIDDYTVSNEKQDITLLEDGSFNLTIDYPLYGSNMYYRAYYCLNGKTYYGEVLSIPMPYAVVDMGLSVNWATINVGANSISEFGDYFAWGETETYYKSGFVYDYSFLPIDIWKDAKNDGYYISNYFDCDYAKGKTYYDDSMSNTKRFVFYKYNNGFYGDTLDISDDAAHILWGEDWRMPYSSEWDELRINCILRDTLYNGAKGIMYTSKLNGNELFIPAAGFIRGSELRKNESKYWSRDYYPSVIYNDYYYYGCEERSYGLPIRPIQEKPSFVKTKGVCFDTERIELRVNEQYTINVAVFPENATNKGLFLETNNEKVATVDENGNIFAVGCGMCIITATTHYGDLKAHCLVLVNDNNNEHESVDLGLSVKWATYNLGASKPEECGYYFHWGSASPLDYEDQQIYYDAAKENWGGEWRIPSNDEWNELSDTCNCSWTWINYNGINGYKVQSKINGYRDNWIFLPASGWQYEHEINGINEYSLYWSDTSSTYRFYFYFNSISRRLYDEWFYTWSGEGSIRPVCP